ncbi:MAG: LptF/LptG family permease, partial [Chthoniobacterales bacterium]
AGFEALLAVYRSQIPAIIVMSIPIAMLLALLYSLTAMSRSNELISMLGAGLSVMRILLPLFVVSFLLTGVSLFFNYSDAPHAAAMRKQMLRDIKRGEKRDQSLSGHLFRNREDNRTWYMRKLWLGDGRLTQVQIIQQDEKGDITEEWFANLAEYDEATKKWKLTAARHIEDPGKIEMNISGQAPEIEIEGWSETPWRISSSVMNPDYLSVRELREYLTYNSDFPEQRLAPYRTHLNYRFALPLACVLVVMLAAPMGIVYSRRGILSGVALAVGLFFSMVFISSLFVALGKGARIPPEIAAWSPIVFFFFVGVFLLWMRSTNRDLPKIPGF